MTQIKILNERCPQDHSCPALKVCLFGALTQEGFSAPIIDEKKCTKCGKCVKVCPMGALSIVQ